MSRLVALAVLFLASIAAEAQQTVGDWMVSSADDGPFIATVNDSGGLLGKYCYMSQNGCVWLIVTSVRCDDNSEYPVLINAEAGATYTSVRCSPISGKNRYVFLNPDLVDQAVKTGAQIGFAFPMQGGSFQVARFGIQRATNALAALQQATQNRPRKPSTRDTTL